MVECSNMHCAMGRWFHLGCIPPVANGSGKDDVLEHVPSGDWWCSEDCRSTNNSAYCVCRKMKGPTISCTNPNCQRGQKFHFNCVGLSPTDANGI